MARIVKQTICSILRWRIHDVQVFCVFRRFNVARISINTRVVTQVLVRLYKWTWKSINSLIVLSKSFSIVQYHRKDVPTVRLVLCPDCRARLFGGPVVWAVFLRDGPATRARELCAACDDDVCTVIGCSLRNFCISGEYLDKGSRYCLWRKNVALPTSRRIPLHFCSQSQ